MSEESDMKIEEEKPLEVKVISQPKPEIKKEEDDKEYHDDIEMTEEELKDDKETEDW